MASPQPSGSGEPKRRRRSSQEPRFFNVQGFCLRFIPVLPLDARLLRSSRARSNQVAGHPGFLTVDDDTCHKPMNPTCARGRREHLFYQLATFFKNTPNPEKFELYFRDFRIFLHPDKICDCRIEPETLRTITRFMPQFRHVRHPIIDGDDYETNPLKRAEYVSQFFEQDPWCPCYSDEKPPRGSCFSNFSQDMDYICLDDLNAHCKTPCILEVKMGRITYDPMASKMKINDQINKYPKALEYGFRILGMRTPLGFKNKHYGKTLTTQEQVFKALESYFDPLLTAANKAVVAGKMLDRLEELLEWFETNNENQFRFYSSSILFVYDVDLIKNPEESQQVRSENLKKSVRASMIDFAHAFHSHEPPTGPNRSASAIATSGDLNKDDNYLYGLRRLIKFFIMLHRQNRTFLRQEERARALAAVKKP